MRGGFLANFLNDLLSIKAYPLRMQPAQSNKMLHLVPVRALTLKGEADKSDKFLSAASGLQKVGDDFHVVADDRLDLGTFRLDPQSAGSVRPLLQRLQLPQDEKERKAVKPDLESLTLLRLGQEKGLLALGSGSTENRRSGVFLALDEQDRPGEPIEFDLTPLYGALAGQFPELNIEGVAQFGDTLRLLQRGNGTSGPNAVLELDLAGAYQAASRGEPLTPNLLKTVKPVDLGTTPGSVGPVPWTFTDLAALPDGRAIFTAAAEDTDNPYDDGEILGSAVGILDKDGTLAEIHQVDQKIKIEGVTLDPDNGYTPYFVTDADDPHKPAIMYRCSGLKK